MNNGYIEEVETLSETDRGEGGYGSTGVSAPSEEGKKRALNQS